MEFVNAFEVKSIRPEEQMFRLILKDLRGEEVELRVQEKLKKKLNVGEVVKMYLEF